MRERDGWLRAVADSWPGPWFLQPVFVLFALSAAAQTFTAALRAEGAYQLVANLVLCALTLVAALAALLVMRAKWLTRCRRPLRRGPAAPTAGDP